MTAQIFSAVIEKVKSRTVIGLPFDPNATWGMREQHHIHGTIQGVAYRGPVVTEDGRFWIAPGPAWLRDAHLAMGAGVEVSLEPEGPQVSTMAADITAALAALPTAQSFFEALPTFYRKNYLRWIEDAKQARTRAARIQEMVQLLADGKRER